MDEERGLVPIASPVTGAVLTPTSFTPDHELTKEEWIAAGRSLGATAQGVQWWIGDWLNYGVERGYVPSDRYDLAEQITGSSRTWLQVCAWVARAVPPKSRRADLSFEHHKRIASLKDGQARDLLLSEAAKGRWTARELSQTATEVMAPATPDSAPAHIPPVQGDDIPDWGFKPYEVIELGPHRLVCGDATDPLVYDALFEGQSQASVLWTDPPYGVNYVGKTKDALTIKSDEEASLLALLIDSFALVDVRLKDGSAFYICHADRTAPLFRLAIEEVGWQFHENLIWVKDRMVMGHSDYHYQYEPIAYGWRPGVRRWFGGRDRVNVLGLEKPDGVLTYTIPNPQASVDHPTMKPPRLIWTTLRNSALQGDIVLDPFAGSGSTMEAAEQLGLRAFMIELEEDYAASIVERWYRANSH